MQNMVVKWEDNEVRHGWELRGAQKKIAREVGKIKSRKGNEERGGKERED